MEWSGDLVWVRRHLRAFNGGPLSPPKSRPCLLMASYGVGGYLSAHLSIYLPTSAMPTLGPIVAPWPKERSLSIYRESSHLFSEIDCISKEFSSYS